MNQDPHKNPITGGHMVPDSCVSSRDLILTVGDRLQQRFNRRSFLT